MTKYQLEKKNERRFFPFFCQHINTKNFIGFLFKLNMGEVVTRLFKKSEQQFKEMDNVQFDDTVVS